MPSTVDHHDPSVLQGGVDGRERDEAFCLVRAGGPDINVATQGTRTICRVPMGPPVEFAGGQVGAALGNPQPRTSDRSLKEKRHLGVPGDSMTTRTLYIGTAVSAGRGVSAFEWPRPPAPSWACVTSATPCGSTTDCRMGPTSRNSRTYRARARDRRCDVPKRTGPTGPKPLPPVGVSQSSEKLRQLDSTGGIGAGHDRLKDGPRQWAGTSRKACMCVPHVRAAAEERRTAGGGPQLRGMPGKTPFRTFWSEHAATGRGPCSRESAAGVGLGSARRCVGRESVPRLASPPPAWSRRSAVGRHWTTCGRLSWETTVRLRFTPISTPSSICLRHRSGIAVSPST